MKKTVIVFLISSILISVFSVNSFAADAPSMSLSDAVVKVGDKTCEMTLSVDSNPGVWSFYALAFYPKGASFSGFSSGEIFPASAFLGPMGEDYVNMRDKSVQNELGSSSISDFKSVFNSCLLTAADYRFTVITANASSTSNIDGDGTMCTFNLDVSGLSAGTYDIAVGCSKANTVRITSKYGDCEYIDFGIARATLTVEPVFMPGDVDGDGSVSTKDSRLLKKYLLSLAGEDDIVFSNSDINGDGYIGTKDSKLLKKLLLAA